MGNVWTLPSYKAARTLFETLFDKFCRRGHKEIWTLRSDSWSIRSGYFEGKGMFTFVWGPDVDPKLIGEVASAVLAAGGEEMEEQEKQLIISRARQLPGGWIVFR